MKICHISTYWPTCNYGHTHYTENLMRGMRLHRPEKHYVLGAFPAAAVDNCPVPELPEIEITARLIEAAVATGRWSDRSRRPG